MKKIVLLMIAGAMLLTSCVSTSGTANNAGKKSGANSRLYAVVDAMKSAKPAKGDVWMMDVNESPENTYSASSFYAASLFMKLDEKFNFGNVMNDSQKVDLARALAANLDNVQAVTDIRAIVIGKYFSETSELDDLYIIIDKVHLKPGVIPNAEYAYRFVTNAILTSNKETGEVKAMCTKTMMNPSLNYNFLAIPFENGMFVSAGNLNLNKENYSADMSLTDKGNLMDSFVKDEIVENDVQIESIYKELISIKDKDLKESDVMVKYVLAPLNYGLYLAKQGKVEEAEKLWNSINISKIPADAEVKKNLGDSLKLVFERDIPDYLLITSKF